MGYGDIDPDIVTPAVQPGFFARLLAEQHLPGLAARAGARAARRLDKPIRVGKRIIAIRHDQVTEILSRDLDFGIAPINAVKIEEVNGGPFILGMDRSEDLERERRALYSALAAVDLSLLREAAQRHIDALLDSVEPGGQVDVVNGYARPVAAGTTRLLFGVATPGERLFMEVVRSIFAHTFLNIGDDARIRARAVKAGRYMKDWLEQEISSRRSTGELGEDMMGMLLRQAQVDDDAVRRTLGGMLVGSIDTTASAVAKILKVIARDPELQRKVKRDLDDPGRLYGWCNEALRRWPHNPILLRRALADTELAGRPIRRGDSVICWTQAAMLDGAVFPEPARLRPDREASAYLHLGAGLHPCAGRAVNRFQIPLLVRGLLKRGVSDAGPVRWAGPFPDMLMVRLSGRA